VVEALNKENAVIKVLEDAERWGWPDATCEIGKVVEIKPALLEA
jgi:hypothetical protein